MLFGNDLIFLPHLLDHFRQPRRKIHPRGNDLHPGSLFSEHLRQVRRDVLHVFFVLIAQQPQAMNDIKLQKLQHGLPLIAIRAHNNDLN